MKKIESALINWGCPLEEALARMDGDFDFFINLLDELFNDPFITSLEEAIKADDAKKIFEYSRALKGIFGNMSLYPLYNIIKIIVEKARNGITDGCLKTFDNFKKGLIRLKRIIEENK